MSTNISNEKIEELMKQYSKIQEILTPEDNQSDSTSNGGTGGLMGWICPVCGRGLSPYTDSCPCVVNWEITCGTGTATPFSGTINRQDAPTAHFKPPREEKYNV